MPRIYVQFSGLDKIGTGCKTVASKVDSIESEFISTVKALDWDIRAASDINNTANRISRKLEQQTNALRAYQRFIEEAHQEYIKLDEYKAVGEVDEAGAVVVSATITEDNVGIFSVGQKIWKTTTAAVKGAVAVAGCAATWAATVASGGAGAPVAVLSTGYTANSLYSCYSDIKNLWWGDESKVGEVNWLKDTVADGAGDISEMLGGDREIGEFVGKCVYGAGELIVNIENAQNVASAFKGETRTTLFENELKDTLISKSHLTLKDRIIQNDTTFDTVVKAVKEIPTAVSGLKDIALNSPLGSIAYDYKLLSHQIKNLQEVAGFAKVLKEVADVTADVTKNVVGLIMPTN